ncbi:MAG: hypothetical protein R3F14_16430 [Polyangiaceae bacterium]
MAYLEVTDGWPSRQVEVYGETWRWGDDEHPEHLADQPLDVLELDEQHAISREAFDTIWQQALERTLPRLPPSELGS